MTITRLGWDDTFLQIASVISMRSDCALRQVGVVVVSNYHIIGYGYPASPKGCLEGRHGCSRGRLATTQEGGLEKCTAVHAVTRALLCADAAKCAGATLYTTDEPCESCWALIQTMGIQRVCMPRPIIDRIRRRSGSFETVTTDSFEESFLAQERPR